MLPDIEELVKKYVTPPVLYFDSCIEKSYVEVLYKINSCNVYYTDICEIINNILRDTSNLYRLISRSYRYISFIKISYNSAQLNNFPHEINYLVNFNKGKSSRTRELNMSICQIKRIDSERYEKLKEKSLKRKHL